MELKFDNVNHEATRIATALNISDWVSKGHEYHRELMNIGNTQTDTQTMSEAIQTYFKSEVVNIDEISFKLGFVLGLRE